MHEHPWTGAISQYPAITLVGWTSAWQMRICLPDPSRRTMAPPVPGHTLTVTWIHHRHYGMLGIYWPHRRHPAHPVRVPTRPWVVVTGRIVPCLVAAQADDPRARMTPAATPLLVLVEQIRRAQPAETMPTGQPMLSVPAAVALGASRALPGGYLAATPWPDLVFWSRSPLRPGRSRWNSVRGVVMRCAAQRVVRYVLTYVEPEGGFPYERPQLCAAGGQSAPGC